MQLAALQNSDQCHILLRRFDCNYDIKGFRFIVFFILHCGFTANLPDFELDFVWHNSIRSMLILLDLFFTLDNKNAFMNIQNYKLFKEIQL